MKKQVRLCDHCGVEIVEKNEENVKTFSKKSMSDISIDDYDFCEVCFEKAYDEENRFSTYKKAYRDWMCNYTKKRKECVESGKEECVDGYVRMHRYVVPPIEEREPQNYIPMPEAGQQRMVENATGNNAMVRIN